MMNSPSLLNVTDLRVYFHTRNGIIKAVDGIDFDLQPGATLGIVGESGSGKSVACQSLMGLLPVPPARVESGSAVFDGIDLLKAGEETLRKVRGNRISMIFQDPMTSLNPYLTVAEQLIEPLRIHMGHGRRQALEMAKDAMAEVGIPNPGRRMQAYPHEFSGGMRQRVMIAMALIAKPEILIADEPTTALDVTIQAQILDLIKKLQQEHGIGVIFITHDLGVIAGIADDVLVMNRGKVVERGSAEDIFYRTRDEYTRKLLDSIPVTGKPEHMVYTPGKTPDVLLTIDSLRTWFEPKTVFFNKAGTDVIKAVDEVSLSVYRGEILGLVGESGSGKSTTGRSIVRLNRVTGGTIRLLGNDLLGLEGEKLRNIRHHVQMIFQDPYASLNPRMTVYDTLAEALGVNSGFSGDSLLQQVIKLMRDVGLEAAQMRKYPHEFSGGQRQRIAIARAIALRPILLIADEPVSALDVTIQAQILDLLMELTRKYDLSMIFISHDLSVIRYITDRTAVMYQGRIVELAPTEELFHNPKHAYTKSLLSAIPVPDPVKERERVHIPYRPAG